MYIAPTKFGFLFLLSEYVVWSRFHFFIESFKFLVGGVRPISN